MFILHTFSDNTYCSITWSNSSRLTLPPMIIRRCLKSTRISVKHAPRPVVIWPRLRRPFEIFSIKVGQVRYFIRPRSISWFGRRGRHISTRWVSSASQDSLDSFSLGYNSTRTPYSIIPQSYTD